MAIIKESLVYICGEIIAKFMPFLLLPYLAGKLGVANYGELSLYQTYMTLIFVIVSYSQNSALSRYFYRYGKLGVPDIFSTGLLLTILTSVPFVIIFASNNQYVFGSIIFTSIFQTLVFNYLSIFQCNKQPIKYVLVQLFVNFLVVFFIVFQFEYVGASVSAYFNSFLLSYFIVFVFLFFNKKEYFSFNPRGLVKLAKFILSFGFPLVIHQLCLFAKGGVDRFIIGGQYGGNELGIYAMAFQISSILQVVFIALNRSILPYYYKGLKDGRINENSILAGARISMLFPLASIFILGFIPERFYLYFLGSEFSGIKWFIMIFVFGISINLIYFSLINYFFYNGYTKIIAKANLVSAVIHVIFVLALSLVSVKFVAFSLIISNIVLCSILYFYVRVIAYKGTLLQ